MPTGDVKQQEEGKTEREDNRHGFLTIVEALHEGILILDNGGKVLYCNAGAGALFNRPVQALVGTTLDMPAVEGGAGEVEIVHPVAGHNNVQIRVHRTTWCGREARLVVLTNIAERKVAEDELEQARQTQLRMKDEILSRVSHELRSPLTAVYQYVTILLDGLAGEINEDQREYLGIALRNVKQLQAMIGDLLDVTRSKSGKLTVNPLEMSLVESLEAALNTLRPNAQAKNLALSVQIEEGLPSAFADPQRVEQVIVNLLGNAIKFTPERGTIRMAARVCKQLPERLLAEGPAAPGKPLAPFLEIAVADSGCGIAEEDHERIFHQLYQVDKNIDQKRMGLGLGLYICRELVSRLDGRIWVESRPGEGSTFFFTLPVYTPEQALLSLLRDRLAQSKATGEPLTAVVLNVEADEEMIRPVWDALLVSVRAKAFAAAYAGTRFVVLADVGDDEAETLRNDVRRWAKDACFTAAPDLCAKLSYGVAVSDADTESADSLLTRAGSAAVSESSVLAQKKVIVVDDDEATLRLLYRVMAKGVHSVRMAASGPELFAAITQELPDLIVVDIVMPGMNGHEVIGRLKENETTAKIPIVVVSGYISENETMEDKTLGAGIPLLSKMNMNNVRRWVQHLL